MAGNPFSPHNQDSGQLFVVGTVTGSGDNQIIAAPGAGWRLVIVGLQLANAGIVANTVILKLGATNVYRDTLEAAGREQLNQLFWRSGGNVAGVLNLSVAGTISYAVWYYVEQV